MPRSNVANARLPVTGARDIWVTSRPAPKTASLRSSTLAIGIRVQSLVCSTDGTLSTNASCPDYRADRWCNKPSPGNEFPQLGICKKQGPLWVLVVRKRAGGRTARSDFSRETAVGLLSKINEFGTGWWRYRIPPRHKPKWAAHGDLVPRRGDRPTLGKTQFYWVTA
jgi:hypothetical protein